MFGELQIAASACQEELVEVSRARPSSVRCAAQGQEEELDEKTAASLHPCIPCILASLHPCISASSELNLSVSEFKTPVVFKCGCSESCWLESKHKEWQFNTVVLKAPVVFKTRPVVISRSRTRLD